MPIQDLVRWSKRFPSLWIDERKGNAKWYKDIRDWSDCTGRRMRNESIVPHFTRISFQTFFFINCVFTCNIHFRLQIHCKFFGFPASSASLSLVLSHKKLIHHIALTFCSSHFTFFVLLFSHLFASFPFFARRFGFRMNIEHHHFCWCMKAYSNSREETSDVSPPHPCQHPPSLCLKDDENSRAVWFAACMMEKRRNASDTCTRSERVSV